MTGGVERAQATVQTYPPLTAEGVAQLCASHDLVLPRSFEKFLATTNGARSADGYFRIFGIGSRSEIDGLVWNAPDTWKFAWPENLQDFWCFAETAWGDQYAFELDGKSERVLFLDAISMQAESIANSFADFYQNEFLRNVASPYDEMTRQAQRRFGALSPAEHLVHSPSILISHAQDIEQVQRMPLVAAMILNGDLFSQLGTEEQIRPLKGLQTYLDAKGRTRTRVEWLSS